MDKISTALNTLIWTATALLIPAAVSNWAGLVKLIMKLAG